MKLNRRFLVYLLLILLAQPLVPAPAAAAGRSSASPLAEGPRELNYVPESGAFIIYGTPGGLVGCRDATPEEAREILRRDPSLRLRPITHVPGEELMAMSAETADSQASAVAGMKIVLRATPQLEANAAAKAAFVRAAAVWESLITSPVTVVIDVDYGPTRFGQAFSSNNTLGSTSGQSLYWDNNYPDIRARLVSRASSAQETALYNTLPSGSIPTDLGSAATVLVPSPVLRALGLMNADASVEPGPGSPPAIGFNSNFTFDLNPDDGITPGQTDFNAVAVHEIGHALGFTSEAGARELDPARGLFASLWDVFRFRPSTAQGAFATAPRVLSSGGSQVHYDGGTELPLSTGKPDGTGGDGRQSSHWKDDALNGGVFVGIMDPTIPSGRREELTASDRRAVDFLGYQVSAGTTPTLPGVGFEAATVVAAEGAGRADLRVVRGGDLSLPVSVFYSTLDGPANDRQDYTAAAGTLNFAAGEAAKTVTVYLTDDVRIEGDEFFQVELRDASLTSITAGGGLAQVIIRDNDTAAGAPNPIDDTNFFVRQHYVDFLNREPDQAGLDFWANQIRQCQQAGATCSAQVRRINVSAAFFLSIEFQETGYLVYKLHQLGFGSGPRLRMSDFLLDMRQIGNGVAVGLPGWDSQLERNKQAFLGSFVARPAFLAQFPQAMSAASFVDALNARTADPLNPAAGGSLTAAERNQLVADLGAGTKTRAEVVRAVAENALFGRRESNRAFVLMQYFGYLRRNPNDLPDTDFGGYNFWLGKLNQFGGNYQRAQMVQAFIESIEYRQRFGP